MNRRVFLRSSAAGLVASATMAEAGAIAEFVDSIRRRPAFSFPSSRDSALALMQRQREADRAVLDRLPLLFLAEKSRGDAFLFSARVLGRLDLIPFGRWPNLVVGLTGNPQISAKIFGAGCQVNSS